MSGFVHPACLLLCLLPPALAGAAVWGRMRRARRVARLAGPAKGREAARDVRFFAQAALCAAGLSLCAVALARPQWGERDEPVFASSRNVLLLLDVSRSMLAEDVRPSRLERAKADLADLVGVMEGDRAGLLAFRGAPAALCPLTTDTSFLLQALEAASPESAPRGETDLGAALEKALDLFGDLPADHNAVVLVTDGEDLSGRAREAAAEFGRRRIPVFCVGVGGAEGAEIPSGGPGSAPLSWKGEPVRTKLDGTTLEAVASASGGVYLPLETTAGGDTLGTIYRDHVRSLVEQEAAERSERRRVERYPWFLWPGLVLLLAAAALSRGRPPRNRVRSRKEVSA